MSVFAGTFIAVVPVVAEESNDQIFQLAAFGDSPEAFEMDSRIPEVLTTTRLRQPKSRVPGTTTIITGEMIRDLGIMNLVEVFRLVPGMTVAEVFLLINEDHVVSALIHHPPAVLIVAEVGLWFAVGLQRIDVGIDVPLVEIAVVPDGDRVLLVAVGVSAFVAEEVHDRNRGGP